MTGQKRQCVETLDSRCKERSGSLVCSCDDELLTKNRDRGHNIICAERTKADNGCETVNVKGVWGTFHNRVECKAPPGSVLWEA